MKEGRLTSWWSPKMESACPAIARAATWNTQGVSSPATLYMFGIIKSSPWEDVYLRENSGDQSFAASGNDVNVCGGSAGAWGRAGAGAAHARRHGPTRDPRAAQKSGDCAQRDAR